MLRKLKKPEGKKTHTQKKRTLATDSSHARLALRARISNALFYTSRAASLHAPLVFAARLTTVYESCALAPHLGAPIAAPLHVLGWVRRCEALGLRSVFRPLSATPRFPRVASDGGHAFRMVTRPCCRREPSKGRELCVDDSRAASAALRS